MFPHGDEEKKLPHQPEKFVEPHVNAKVDPSDPKSIRQTD
jgi:hypothetical protein